MGTALAPALAPYVTSVVAYDVELGGAGVHRGLPSTSLTFVLPVDEPIDVGWQGVPESRGRRWSTVSGLHAGPAEIHHGGHQRGIQLGLTLAGAWALLGVPAGSLAGRLEDLPTVAPGLRHLPEQLADAAPNRWLGVVERALLGALRRSDPPRTRPEVGRALALLTRGAAVQRVADEVGYSRRHLGSLVRAESGLSPKQLQRVGRFAASRNELAGGSSLADTAAACGYADQAHLTREWVAFAGCPPTTWLREELPFLQDLDPGDAAG